MTASIRTRILAHAVAQGYQQVWTLLASHPLDGLDPDDGEVGRAQFAADDLITAHGSVPGALASSLATDARQG